ncbi:hypothetical protein, partial [Cohnella luojiensis]|uniref:hypothetical protein n=1 Tax=Cohnella luojiensis TaxID=652876 RepID=UPI00196AA39D
NVSTPSKFGLSCEVKVQAEQGLTNHSYRVLRRNGRPPGEVYTENHAGHRETHLLKQIEPRNL